MTSKVYIGLGSNMEPRTAFIGRALAAMALRTGALAVRCSAPVQSAPDGFVSNNVFVNAVAELTFRRERPWTVDDALTLLDILQGIERSISQVPHRNADGSYRDREIDLDILLIDDLAIAHPRLTVPHPRMADRPFVTVPLAELKG